MQVQAASNMTGIEQSMFGLINSVAGFGDQLLKGEVVHTGGKWVYGEKVGAKFCFRWEDKAAKLKVTYYVNDLHDEQVVKDIHNMINAYNKMDLIPVIRRKVGGEWVESNLASMELARINEIEERKAKKLAKKEAAATERRVKKQSEKTSLRDITSRVTNFFGDLAEALGGEEGRRRLEKAVQDRSRTAAVNDSQEVVAKTEEEAVTPAAEAPVEAKEAVTEVTPAAKEEASVQTDIPPVTEATDAPAAETAVQTGELIEASQEETTEAKAEVAAADEKPVKARKPRSPSKVLPKASK